MATTLPTFSNIDEYIALYPPELQQRLQQLRQVIRDAAPDATERISWQMPTFYLHGNLVHFAMHKTHVGFYPGADGVAAFQKQLAAYKTSKGAVQFPLSQPIPFDLVTEIVQFRVAENQKEALAKAQKKKTPHKKT